jgi:excinuclease ABC subunit C
LLEEALKTLPNLPGVYKFYDQSDTLLYVGKAKILKNRVKSYFRFTPTLAPSNTLSPRIYKMISECYKCQYIVSSNEYDALILENSLIKELKPKYNILLRDDKTYPYIMLNMQDTFPRFEITRKVQNNPQIKYFGPFSNGSRDILEALYLSYKLVQKKSCIKGKKSCLFYQINRCHAPCEGKISQEQYQQILDEAKLAIVDRKRLITKLNEKMEQASQMLNFEEAAKLRDMQSSIKKTLHVIELDLAKVEDFDLFSIEVEKNIASFMYLFIRNGKVVSSINKITKHAIDYELDELYKVAIMQFYKTNPQTIPKKIYVAQNFEYEEDVKNFIFTRFNKKVQIINPKKGDKLSLVNIALKNAKENLKNYKINDTNIENEIQHYFELSSLPLKIEVFDNSHISGDSIVGCMVVYENGFVKEDYRTYNLTCKDEYAQMKELLSRRIDKHENEPLPDLWIIDGGDTLLKLAKKLLDAKGLHVNLIAIAKEKRDFKANRAKSKANDIIYTLNQSYKLSSFDKKLHFIQKLRDEAHRFAITTHRKKKQKKDMKISLLEASGIGSATIKKLLSYFGSFENIYDVTYEELKEIISEKNALSLYNFLNK